MLGEDHDKTRKYLPRHVCRAQAFCLPVYPAVLLRKLTNNYKTFLSLSSKKKMYQDKYISVSKSRQNTQVLAPSRLTRTSVLPSCLPCRPVA